MTLDPAAPRKPSLRPYQNILDASGYDTKTLIHILAHRQELRVYMENIPVFTCPVSTARRGLGEKVDSFQTPRGLHVISEIIGSGEPEGRMFRSRILQSEIWSPGQACEDDLILTRILWLDGLEPGRNRGENVDTKQRLIYLHGTNHEDQIGRPVSAGCIRLTNRDIITLADQWARPGQLCLIEDGS